MKLKKNMKDVFVDNNFMQWSRLQPPRRPQSWIRTTWTPWLYRDLVEAAHHSPGRSLIEMQLGWTRKSIFLLREIRNECEIKIYFAKFRTNNFAKFRTNNFAEFREISQLIVIVAKFRRQPFHGKFLLLSDLIFRIHPIYNSQIPNTK
jgi:hypothetical protein